MSIRKIVSKKSLELSRVRAVECKIFGSARNGDIERVATRATQCRQQRCDHCATQRMLGALTRETTVPTMRARRYGIVIGCRRIVMESSVPLMRSFHALGSHCNLFCDHER